MKIEEQLKEWQHLRLVISTGIEEHGYNQFSKISPNIVRDSINSISILLQGVRFNKKISAGIRKEILRIFLLIKRQETTRLDRERICVYSMSKEELYNAICLLEKEQLALFLQCGFKKDKKDLQFQFFVSKIYNYIDNKCSLLNASFRRIKAGLKRRINNLYCKDI
jgi:hypothetical protein